MSQFFSPEFYGQTGLLAYASSQQMNSGLLPNSCIIKEHSVNLHQVKIFNSKAYDMSTLTTFDMSTSFNSYSFKFWNTIPRPYVKVPGNLAGSTGIFQLDFIQNPKIYIQSLSINSLDVVIAYLGGYINAIYFGFVLLTSCYRDFNLDQSLIKRIYSEDGRDTSAEPRFDFDVDLIRKRT